MTIKSDKWIRRMAAQHGMIEPFEPQLVREIDGRKIARRVAVKISEQAKDMTSKFPTIVIQNT